MLRSTCQRAVLTCSRSLRNTAHQSTATQSAVNKIGAQSNDVFEKEKRYGAHNYGPIPVAIDKGEGSENVTYNIRISYFACY